jgi:GxxExxY protein
MLEPNQTVEDPLTRRIIGAAIEVHRALGPGLLESAYELCLGAELEAMGLGFARQVELPVTYRGVTLPCGYRIDLVVEGQVIVEVKSIEKVMPIHQAQVLTYLRLARLHRALLINFNVPVLHQGIVRLVL